MTCFPLYFPLLFSESTMASLLCLHSFVCIISLAFLSYVRDHSLSVHYGINVTGFSSFSFGSAIAFLSHFRDKLPSSSLRQLCATSSQTYTHTPTIPFVLSLKVHLRLAESLSKEREKELIALFIKRESLVKLC